MQLLTEKDIPLCGGPAFGPKEGKITIYAAVDFGCKQFIGASLTPLDFILVVLMHEAISQYSSSFTEHKFEAIKGSVLKRSLLLTMTMQVLFWLVVKNCVFFRFRRGTYCVKRSLLDHVYYETQGKVEIVTRTNTIGENVLPW